MTGSPEGRGKEYGYVLDEFPSEKPNWNCLLTVPVSLT